MNFKAFKLSTVRLFRALAIVFTCTLLCFAAVQPAWANSHSARNNSQFGIGDTVRSNPTKGEEHLDATFEESEEMLRRAPASMNVQERAQEGPNEVQADADLDKMSRPENSQGAFSFEDKVEQALEKITPGK